MKRSEINSIMRDADAFIRLRGFQFPSFAYWTPADWEAKGLETREIVERQLGWDITDFGHGDFRQIGLFMFTLRNGILRELKNSDAQVAELSARPIEKEEESLWRQHNARAMTRPLIFCDPENGWTEIIRPDSLTCQHELARQWEFILQREIFWDTQMKDDRVIRWVEIARQECER
jgi:hypothetical protein